MPLRNIASYICVAIAIVSVCLALYFQRHICYRLEPFETLVFHAHIPRNMPKTIRQGEHYEISNAYHALIYQPHLTGKTPTLLHVDHDIRESDKLVMFKNKALTYIEKRQKDNAVINIAFRDAAVRHLFLTQLADLFIPSFEAIYPTKKIVIMPSHASWDNIVDSVSPVLWLSLLNENKEYTTHTSTRVLDYMALLPSTTFRKISLRLPFVKKTHILFKDLLSPNNVISVAQDVENFSLQVLAFDRVMYTHISQQDTCTQKINRLLYTYFLRVSLQSALNDAALQFYARLGYPCITNSDLPREHFTQDQDQEKKPIVFRVPVVLDMHPRYPSFRLPIFHVDWPLVELEVRLAPGDRVHVSRQNNSYENGIYKVLDVTDDGRSITLAQVHYIAYMSPYIKIRSMNLDKTRYDIEILGNHPYIMAHKNIMEKGDLCFVDGPFAMYGYIQEIRKDKPLMINVHLFEDEYVFRNDYECLGDTSKLSKQSCESDFSMDRMSKGSEGFFDRQERIWDRRCASDAECPFLQKDATNPKRYRGTCSKNGYCEMPFNVKRVGFRHFTLSDNSFPLCKGCESYITNRQEMEKCCQKKMYIF